MLRLEKEIFDKLQFILDTVPIQTVVIYPGFMKGQNL